jgi:hypothetical protein
MNQQLIDMLIMVGMYFVIMCCTIFFLNFLTNSFLFTYLRVKATRGKSFFLRINYVGGRYYRLGKLKDASSGLVQYKDQAKVIHSFNINREDVVNEMGVKCIEYDESTNSVIRKDYSATNSHNTEKIDSLIERALYKPQLMDKSVIQILMIIILVIILCAVIYLIFKDIKHDTMFNTMQSTLNNISITLNPLPIPKNVVG